jgi:hypothetical protein
MAETEAEGDGGGWGQGGPLAVDFQCHLDLNGNNYTKSLGAAKTNGTSFANAKVHTMLTEHVRA